MRLATIDFEGWHLKSGQAMNEAYPNMFHIPSAEKRGAVVPTDFVKLSFEFAEVNSENNELQGLYGERMWVKIEGSYGPYLWGALWNHPTMPLLSHGDLVVFLPEHILDIVDATQQERDEREFHRTRGCRESSKAGPEGGKG